MVESVRRLGGQKALKSLACFVVNGSLRVERYALNEHDWLSINGNDDVGLLSLTADGQLLSLIHI